MLTTIHDNSRPINIPNRSKLLVDLHVGVKIFQDGVVRRHTGWHGQAFVTLLRHLAGLAEILVALALVLGRAVLCCVDPGSDLVIAVAALQGLNQGL